MNTNDPPGSGENHLADTNDKNVYTGLLACLLIIIALAAALVFKMNREKPVEVPQKLTREIEMMKEFFTHLDQIATTINDEKGWMLREEFSVEVYEHFETLRSKDPATAALGLHLWTNKLDLWGNDLVIRYLPLNDSDERVRIVITSAGPPDLEDWNEKVVFTTKNW